MSHQGDNPNRRQERQQPTTGFQQGTQPQQSQQPSQSTTQGHQQPTQQQRGQQQQPQQWQQQQWQQPTRTQQTPQQTQQPQAQGTPMTTQQTGAGVPQTQTSQPQQPSAATSGAVTSPTQQPGGGMQAQTQAQPTMPGPRLQPMRVEDVIQTDVVTAQQDTPVSNVVAKMAENNVGTVVVVEEDGQTPIGIITDRKIALAIEAAPDIAERTVDEFVSGTLVTGTTEMSVADVVERLQDEGIRRLPIVDEKGALEGIVSLDDLLIVFSNQFKDAISVIENQIKS